MDSAGAAPEPGAATRGSRRYSRVLTPAAVEFWWVEIPARLCAYSRTLCAAWSDGIYLTKWPRTSLLLPLAAMILGLFMGATHWSPLTIFVTSLSSTAPAISFMQMFYLLIIAVVLSAVSVNLGLMLIVGFAIGDYLVAGPFLTLNEWTPLGGFVRLRLPQLLSYVIFFGLVAAPTLWGRALIAPFWRRIPKDGFLWISVRVVSSAIMAMVLVFAWTLVAPMTLRVVWSWAKMTPPLAVRDYRHIVDPWLPLAAGIGVVARALLVRCAYADDMLKSRIARLHQVAAMADHNPGWSRRSPGWLRAILAALVLSLVLVGFTTTWSVAALVFLALACICLLRNWILPASGVWVKWTRTLERMPVIIRLAVAGVATYYAVLAMLGLPGWSVQLNANPGHFETVLACFGVGLLIYVLLLPYPSRLQPGEATVSLPPMPASTVRAAMGVLWVAAFLGGSRRAYAICEDPRCCFSIDPDLAIAIAIVLLALSAVILLGLALEAAAAEAAAAGLEGGALGDISPLARTISPLAKSVLPPP